jgi:membrane protein YdbS with pleckstrin-like domain
MASIEEHLLPGERIIHRARPHWVMFGLPLGLGLLGLAAGGALQYFAGDYWYAGVALTVLALILAIGPVLRYATSEFAVTDKRVLARVGILQRTWVETLLSKIEAIGVEQDLPGRVLGYGTISITGTGGTRETIQRIADPLDFRRQVQAQIVELEARRGPAELPAGAAPRVERECPFCAEPILARARVCKHCGRDVQPA